jgi:hypothetical protein
MCTGTGGTCEITGFCSFSDSGCTEGRRYGDLAGKFSGPCVGDIPIDIDGGVDDAPGDGTVADVPVNTCPTSYLAISGQTNRYRVIANQAAYATQKAACAADGANTYLAIPDNQTELTALLTAAGANAWVGIDDLANDDSYVTVKGAAFSSASLLWDSGSGEPNDNPVGGGPAGSGDCVAGFTSSQRLADDRCTNTRAAVCECDP